MSTLASGIISRHRYTVDEYHRIGRAGILREEDRVELIEGEIIDMSPIGSRHAATVARISRILTDAVGDSAIVWVQNPILLNDRSEPQPDLALLKPRDDFYASAHPRADDVFLIVEVADSSLPYDREIKLPLYAKHGIAEVWLVDLEHNALFTHRQPLNDQYTEISQTESLENILLPDPPGGMIDLSGLF